MSCESRHLQQAARNEPRAIGIANTDIVIQRVIKDHKNISVINVVCLRRLTCYAIEQLEHTRAHINPGCAGLMNGNIQYLSKSAVISIVQPTNNITQAYRIKDTDISIVQKYET